MPSSSHHPTGPLNGVRVLDLSRVLAGPFATQQLGDFGAEIIKVERPNVGDDTRRWGPPFAPSGPDGEGQSAYFLSANRNKKSVTVDFKTPEGANLVRKLAAKSDILVENFKAGSLKAYGLDYEALREINPRLVYCSITGFGQTGPWADRPGYDFIVQALGGLMSITGQPNEDPNSEPMKVGVAIADLFTGLNASNAILAAFHNVRETGVGQHIDIALQDCQLSMLANQAMNYLVSGVSPSRLGNAHPNIVPYQTFKTKTDHIIVAVGNDTQFTALCHVLNAGELSKDTRFATNTKRVINKESLTPLLQAILLNEGAHEWLNRLEEEKVPCAPVQTIERALSDQHCEARSMVIEQELASGVTGKLVGSPVKFSETKVQYALAPPALGADTSSILSELLGLSKDELSSLQAKGVV